MRALVPPVVSGVKLGHLSLVWKILWLQKNLGHLKLRGGGLKYAPTVRKDKTVVGFYLKNEVISTILRDKKFNKGG